MHASVFQIPQGNFSRDPVYNPDTLCSLAKMNLDLSIPRMKYFLYEK